jgi:hypothetical protein
MDTRLLEHGHDLLASVEVEVVISEHGVDGDVERPARVRQDCGLRGVAVRRQVAAEQKDVRLPVERGERAHDPLAQRLRAVDVCSRGNADRLCHRPASSPTAAFTN